MPVRRSTSAETAARFLAMPKHTAYKRRSWRRAVNPRPDDRLKLDIARATGEELLSCVEERMKRYEGAGKEPDHITLIAWTMVYEALGGVV